VPDFHPAIRARLRALRRVPDPTPIGHASTLLCANALTCVRNGASLVDHALVLDGDPLDARATVAK
jgi:hypothetical protein